jgi:hypothetical protein
MAAKDKALTKLIGELVTSYVMDKGYDSIISTASAQIDLNLVRENDEYQDYVQSAFYDIRDIINSKPKEYGFTVEEVGDSPYFSRGKSRSLKIYKKAKYVR